MNKKVKEAEEFLKSLEDPMVGMDIMLDRIDIPILYVIHNYAELIARMKAKTDMEDKEILTSTIVIGFLLKSHLDRVDLERIMKETVE